MEPEERSGEVAMNDIRHDTRFAEAINRYLGVAGYQPADSTSAIGRSTRTGLVVVGVDDSPAGLTAADHAAIEAQLHGWDLRILHVQRPGGFRRPDNELGAALLERLTERVRTRAPSVAVTSRLVVGSPAALLLAEARTAGLVVVGNRHGRTNAVFGISISDRVAAHHPGAVLVVRIPGWPPEPGFGRKPIIVGVDGEENPAVAFARDEALVRGCDLVLLYAGRTPRPATVDTAGGVRTHRRFVPDDPATALINVSGEAAALVVGRHGTSRVTDGVLGSVSRAVVQHAHCPVFLVD
jgi:nucleotide-binding universal stress UspA family protein